MFYWLAAIPFFIALMMLAVVKAPTHDNLKNPENAQTDAAVFRMATQHDMAVRYIEARYAAGNSITNKAAITQANMTPYITNGYIGDYNLVKSYVVCADNDCSKAEKIRVVTVLDPTNGAAYLNTDRLGTFIKQLGNYKAAFPMNRKSGEAHNYKGFGKNAYHYAGKVMRTAKSADIFMMEQKEGDNYILPNEVNTLTISNKKVLADGKPAIVSVIGEQPQPQVCSDTQTVSNEIWLKHADRCSACSSGQVQQRDIVITDTTYPYVSNTICLDIPSSGNSTTWTLEETDYTVAHTVVSITCGTKTEKYHLIGPKVSWWEAVEICKKLGLNMPLNRDSLINTSTCGGTSRQALLKNALTGLISIPYVWTQEADVSKVKNAWRINLNDGGTHSSYRYSSTNISNGRAICGPKI